MSTLVDEFHGYLYLFLHKDVVVPNCDDGQQGCGAIPCFASIHEDSRYKNVDREDPVAANLWQPEFDDPIILVDTRSPELEKLPI